MEGGYCVFSRSRKGRALLALEGEDTTEVVVFGLYGRNGRRVGLLGDTDGEIAVHWWLLRGGESSVPALELNQEAWPLLERFGVVFERLARVGEEALSPDAFCQILQQCGLRDLT